jgi:hypothetical protein
VGRRPKDKTREARTGYYSLVDGFLDTAVLDHRHLIETVLFDAGFVSLP